MVTTAVAVANPRSWLSFVRTDRKSRASSLFLRIGFLLGRYVASGTSDEPDTVMMLTEPFGSAVCLVWERTRPIPLPRPLR